MQFEVDSDSTTPYPYTMNFHNTLLIGLCISSKIGLFQLKSRNQATPANQATLATQATLEATATRLMENVDLIVVVQVAKNIIQYWNVFKDWN